jgi:hypothetical protein
VQTSFVIMAPTGDYRSEVREAALLGQTPAKRHWSPGWAGCTPRSWPHLRRHRDCPRRRVRAGVGTVAWPLTTGLPGAFAIDVAWRLPWRTDIAADFVATAVDFAATAASCVTQTQPAPPGSNARGVTSALAHQQLLHRWFMIMRLRRCRRPANISLHD